LNYLREKSPGFNNENVVVITDPSLRLGGKTGAFIRQLRQNSFEVAAQNPVRSLRNE